MNGDATLRLSFDWEPAETVRAPELRATWARLEVLVGGECVTQAEDVELGSVGRSIYVPLYPLAEWIAYNWWFLKAHSRPASFPRALWSFASLRGAGGKLNRWLEHHNVRAAGDGFLWPNLTIVPEGQFTRLAWFPDGEATEQRPIRFIRRGDALVNSAVLEHTLARFVDHVLTRLDEQHVRETPLSKEWRALQQTSDEEAEFCIAAARLGLDPFSEALPAAASIERASAELGSELFDDFVSAVSPKRIDAGLAWVTKARRLIAEQAPNGRVDAVRAQVAPGAVAPGARPWELGYRQAARLRDAMGLAPEAPFDARGLMSVVRSNSHDPGLQAVGGRSARDTDVLILGRPAGERASRFAQARALWHFVFEPAPRSFLITPAYTERQKIERAFAAELLAPAEGILRVLDLDTSEYAIEDVEAIAEHFNVSSTVVRHQIDNQVLPALS
jgi:hypothetical protein